MIKNDYFHRETDAYTNPNRPLPSHRLTPRQALVPASVIYATCVICGFLLSIKAGLLVMALVAISHLYNAFFKAKGVLGSLTLPLGIGLLNIFGALVVSDNIPRLVWYAFGATTLYDLGTHITTTFKDISRDEKHGIMTTPIQLGIRPALLLSAFATVLAFAVALLPYWLEPLEQKTYADLGYSWIACSRNYTSATLFTTDGEERIFCVEGFNDRFYSLFSVFDGCKVVCRCLWRCDLTVAFCYNAIAENIKPRGMKDRLPLILICEDIL